MSDETERDDEDGGGGGMEDAGGMPVEEGAPLWMTTFGDLMSLLLTFFVLLFSMSEIKADKFAMAAQSFREATGGTAVIEAIDPQGLVIREANQQLKAAQDGDGEDRDPKEVDDPLNDVGERSISEVLADQFLESIAEQVREFIQANSLEETLLVEEGPSGVRVRIDAGALFRAGSGSLEADAAWIIEFLGDLTQEIDVPVIVAGHADNQPINTPQFRSNWELSAYRAAGIARRLTEDGIPEERLRVESFGSAQPVASNETAEGRAQNRRVEFFYDRDDIIEQVAKWRANVVTGPEAPPTSDPTDVVAEGNPGGD